MLDLVILSASLLGIALGGAGLKLRWQGSAWLLALAIVAWLARAVAIAFGTNASLAEDYVDGLDLSMAALELAVVLLWLLGCYGVGALIRRVVRHRFRPGL